MGDDYAWVGETMRATVPWVAAAGVTFGTASAQRVVAVLPDDATTHNHIGGPHAAMIFGLGETASGAVGLAAFAGTMDRATPLVVRSEVDYRKVARGELTATAELTRPAEEVIAELDAGMRPEFTVRVTITDAAGATTAELSVRWTLRPNRAGAASE